ncbi:MAG: hypothetical protein AAGC60_13250 [Acidobacteriota bacterium]
MKVAALGTLALAVGLLPAFVPAPAPVSAAQSEPAADAAASVSQGDSRGDVQGDEDRHVLVGVTSRGSWRVEVRPEPSPIPLNELFAIDVRVTAADDPNTLVERAVVTASGWMPDHKHGATLQPQITSRGDGTAHGVGFLFHMPGRWELRLGVAVDGAMERVALPIDLEP